MFNSNWKKLPGAILIAIPIILFLTVCMRGVVNVPLMDDYDAILQFLATYRGEPNAVAKVWWVLTSQHTQYKLIIPHTIVVFEYMWTGHVNFAVLQWIGNGMMLITGYLLWILLARTGRSMRERIWLFVPVAWILFAPQYFETVDWAMGGLQNLTVVPAAMAALMLLTRNKPAAFAWACIFLSLAIACSGNGFMVGALGALLLVATRRWWRILTWCGVTLAGALLYGVHYSMNGALSPPGVKLFLLNLLITPLVFLGSPANVWPVAMVAGGVLVVAFALLMRRDWYRREPASFAIALFILLSALLVAMGRYGLTGGTASRYRIYSLLFVCTLWIASVRLNVRWAGFDTPDRRKVLAGLITCSVLFCLVTTYKADHILVKRKRLLLAHLSQWEAHPQALVLIPDELPVMSEPQWVSFRKRCLPIMKSAIETHVYVPPDLRR
jgi:hypothetical protein